MDSEMIRNTMDASRESEQAGIAILEKLTEAAQPSSVFGAPVQVGDYSVITASEVTVGLGFGFGGGGGSGPMPDEAAEGEGAGEAGGFGHGGGGGGGTAARPVAVISVGPTGVLVEPVVDVTKLGLAFLTALGGMFLMFSRMKQAGRG